MEIAVHKLTSKWCICILRVLHANERITDGMWGIKREREREFDMEKNGVLWGRGKEGQCNERERETDREWERERDRDR